MSESVRRAILDAAAQLGVDAKIMVRAIANTEYRGRAHGLTTGIDRYRAADRSEHADRLLAPPLDPRHTVNRYGLPEDQRRYHVDDYIRMWERHHRRAMTYTEREILAQGCIGVTKLGLGQRRLDQIPPMNLAFADPASHRAIQSAENVLAPGEIANADVKNFRRLRTRADDLVREHGMNWAVEHPDGTVLSAAQYIDQVEKNLERARTEARETWSNLAKGHIREMLDTRNAAKIEGEMRTFEQVRGYSRKFENILATGPADTGEFMRLVKADPELARLRGVDHQLPTGSPSEWKPVIYAKHFWSGQKMVRDSDGNLLFKEGRFETRATETPDAARFAPDPATGQVDMSGDHGRAKPGYVSFDYGLYDEQAGSWWHANHADYRVYSENGDPVRNPMKVYQSTSEKFFAGYSDFDSSVVCLGFVRNAP
ncbi:hypothetical protein ACWCPQ_11100 [Nocardia sp. NPDC001965]